MRTIIWHLDDVERAVVGFCRVALDVDRSMSLDGAVPSFRVYKNQFETKRVTKAKESRVQRRGVVIT